MRQKVKFLVFLVGIVLLACNMVWAGPMDGGHWFSVDPDSSLGGTIGDIYYTSEDGTNSLPFHLPVSQEVDALSSPEHPPVTLEDMFLRRVEVIFSVDGDSDLYEWSFCEGGLEGDFPNQPPHTVLGSKVHDDENDLGLAKADLDALESDAHYSPYPDPFPTHGVGNVYFSVEGPGNLDDGDVYTWAGANPILYVADEDIAAALGFDPAVEQIDALVVFDVLSSQDTFDDYASGDPAWDLLHSDAIFFSLAPGSFDPVGDNIYYYSATGQAGLFLDPNLSINVDAIDVHHCVPEPASLLLLGAGAMVLAVFKRKRK